MKRLAFIGNFDPVFSSESHYCWTFENRLGWEVVRLQENRVSAHEVIQQCAHADCLFWVHTHSWAIPHENDILDFVKSEQLPAFSYHLDKYWGIPAREGSYLSHPSFHIGTFFSTDGNHDSDWAKAGINHKYMPPGVVEYGACYGRAADSTIPVVFAGSVSYHQEYKFRPEMVHALHANYGESFKVVTGIRETELNNLFASSICTVGDHIFAGEPYYWSDRLPESAGRGAFIVYPFVKGLEEYVKHGLVTYEAQNSQDLINKLDYYLDKGHETERVERRNSVHEYVKRTQTYTNHLSRILEIMDL